jgi:hypothetical protein
VKAGGKQNQSQCQSQSYFTTDGLPPIRVGDKALETHEQFLFSNNACGYSPYVTSSLTRGLVRRLQLLLVLSSAFILRSGSRGIHDHILLSQIRDSCNLEDQVSIFISPRNRVARLYLQALGSLFVASYDSNNCGGGIRPRLHTDLVENTVSDSSSC